MIIAYKIQAVTCDRVQKIFRSDAGTGSSNTYVLHVKVERSYWYFELNKQLSSVPPDPTRTETPTRRNLITHPHLASVSEFEIWTKLFESIKQIRNSNDMHFSRIYILDVRIKFIQQQVADDCHGVQKNRWKLLQQFPDCVVYKQCCMRLRSVPFSASH